MNRCTTAAAKRSRQPHKTKQTKSKSLQEEARQEQSRVPVTALIAWPRVDSQELNHRAPNRWQHRLNREPQTAPSEPIAPRECEWKHGHSGYSAGDQKTLSNKNQGDST